MTTEAIEKAPEGLGAVTDGGVQSAAYALLQLLNSSGCRQADTPEVRAFQGAWNASGGTALAVDGLYGAKTQAALQQALDAGVQQPPQAAPGGCVAAGGSTPTNTLPATVTGAPKNYTVPLLIGAGVLGTGLLGYALYKKKHRRKA